jgi:prolyl oligopeptidase
MNPFFYPNYLEWTRQGGVLAIAHVRGGGELGDEWYKAGYKKTKPNTWKDLIACTEYLHNNNFSRPDKTMIQAGSAGGILVGRAMTDRPDLFGVVIPQVGCMNTLRGEFSPNGPGNIPEFGTVEIEEEFLALKEMDSYHHVKDGVKYPATLITAGMNDPRVIAWQPGKFAARLQASNGSDKPVLFRVDYESGHGQGDSKSKQFEKNADSFSFALWQMGHPDYQSIKQKEKPVD